MDGDGGDTAVVPHCRSNRQEKNIELAFSRVYLYRVHGGKVKRRFSGGRWVANNSEKSGWSCFNSCAAPVAANVAILMLHTDS